MAISETDLWKKIAAARKYWERQMSTLPKHIREARKTLLADLEKAGDTVLAYASLSKCEKRRLSIPNQAAKVILKVHGIHLRGLR